MVRFCASAPCDCGEIGRHKRLKISRFGVPVRFRPVAPTNCVDQVCWTIYNTSITTEVDMKYFWIGMLVMLLAIKPAVGVALFGIFAGGLQTAATAMGAPTYEPPTVSNTPPAGLLNSLVPIETQANEQFSKEGPLANGSTVSAQPVVAAAPVATTPSAKQIAYEKALNKQAILEEHVQYTGTDEVIRRRLGLQPKVPPYELFEYEDDTVSAAVFDKHFQSKFNK